LWKNENNPALTERRYKSARRPIQFAPANDMTMQMRNRFAGIWAIVEYKAKTVLSEAKLLGNGSGFNQKMAEYLMIVRMRFGNARDRFLGNDQNMNWRLRFHIVKGDDFIIFVNNFGRDFASDDFLEKGFAHDAENVRRSQQKVK
jgi:hypothetical protein